MSRNRTILTLIAALLVLVGSVGAVAVVGPSLHASAPDAATPETTTPGGSAAETTATEPTTREATSGGADLQLQSLDDENSNVTMDDMPSTVLVNVTNEGDAAANRTVSLTFDTDHDGTYDAQFGSKTVDLAPGETETVAFTFELEHDQLGTYRYRVASGDDSFVRSLTNYCALGLHDVTAVEAPSSVERGETLAVTATVERTHYRASTQAVDFRLDANGDGRLETLDSANVSLDGFDAANETADAETVTYALDASDLAPGEYEYAVLVGSEGQNGTLTVEAADEPADDGPAGEEPSDEQTGDPSADETAYYQVDLVVGQPNAVLGESTEDFYGPEGRLVAYLHGTSDAGETRSATAGSLRSEYDDALETTGIEVSEDGETATVTVTVEGALTLSLVSYEKPAAGFDRSVEQTMVDARTVALDGETYTFTVDLPDGAPGK